MAKTEARSAYPLSWPDHWPRTPKPGASSFKTSIAGALENVRHSIKLFASDSGQPVADLLISSNVTLGDQRPKDSGVAVYFTWDGLPTCIAVDRYQKVEDNLQAIHHCIEAERTKLRHGGLNLVRAAFQGYAKLPPPSAAVPSREWHEVLEIPAASSLLEAEQAYKRKRSQWHPDRPGGNAEKFREVQAAIDDARKRLK